MKRKLQQITWGLPSAWSAACAFHFSSIPATDNEGKRRARVCECYFVVIRNFWQELQKIKRYFFFLKKKNSKKRYKSR